MEKEMIIVLDFGGQYNQLIARRVRECNVYAEVHPYTLSLEKIKEIESERYYLHRRPEQRICCRIHRDCIQKKFLSLGIPDSRHLLRIHS